MLQAVGAAQSALLLAASVGPRAALADKCVQQYESQLESFLAMSTATTLFIPRHHRPGWYAKEVEQQQSRERRFTDGSAVKSVTNMADHGDYSGESLDIMFGAARAQILGCRIAGGRYWRVTVELGPYLSRLPIAIINHFRKAGSLHAANFVAEYNKTLRTSVCAPWVCEREDVKLRVVPKFLPRLLDRNFPVDDSWFAWPPVLGGLAKVEELADWSDIKLDFVVAGAAHCGTTSLRRNLGQHSEIAFTVEGEDGFFGYEIQHQLLPLKSQVLRFKERCTAAKVAAGGATHELRRTKVGLYNPMLIDSNFSRMLIRQFDDVKVIMIICDPVDRLETIFSRHHYCHPDVQEARRSGMYWYRNPEEACIPSIADVVDDPRFSFSLVPHLFEWSWLFKDHLSIVHQSDIRWNAWVTYSALLGFLGVSQLFPQRHFFTKHNVGLANRSDLCKDGANSSLLRAFKRKFQQEYVTLTWMLRHSWRKVPRELKLRMTRCERQALEVSPAA